MITFLENLKALSFLIIYFSSFLYYRKLKATKRERKLSKSETAVYVSTSIALFTFAFFIFASPFKELMRQPNYKTFVT